LGRTEGISILEVELDNEDWNRFYDRIASLYDIHGHVTIGVSEGVRFDGQQETDAAFGKRKLGGAGVTVAQLVERGLKDRGLGIVFFPFLG
jgi:hypothetical protein